MFDVGSKLSRKFIKILNIKMSKPKIVTIIGAANVDITGFTNQKLIYQDANIGHMKTSPGGVGRNIAENLMRLDLRVNLISIFGDDALSSYIIDSCKDLSLHIEDSLFLKDSATATFLAIMDENNDLALGLSAMDIYDNLKTDFIVSKITQINKSDYVVLETNMPENILQYVVKHAPNPKYVLDTVSGKKALKSKKILPHLYILKTNLLEANMLSDLCVKNEEDYPKLIQYFLDKGVENVFITLGSQGVIYGNAKGIDRQETIPTKIRNTIGAGDSFVSGIVYADSLDLNIHKAANIGMQCAHINVQYNAAVSPEMCVGNLKL